MMEIINGGATTILVSHSLDQVRRFAIKYYGLIKVSKLLLVKH